jgi:hypothetical protein
MLGIAQAMQDVGVYLIPLAKLARGFFVSC